MAYKKPIRITSPKGIAKFPHLSTPDTKFVAVGEYHVKLLLDGADAEALKAKLDEQTVLAVAEMKEQNPKFAKVMKAHTPYKAETDRNDASIETGKTEFTFKMKAKVEPKGKEAFTQKPRIFDAKGVPVLGKLNIGGGSEIKVSFDVVPFFSAKDKIAGVTLRLAAVQVITLRSFGGGTKGSDFGFGAEDGYDAAEAGDSFVDETESESGSGDATDALTDAPSTGPKQDASDF
jgi:hypothetical protein